MTGYNDEVARMVIKRGSGVPTIPPSADHRNGDWIDTDIYEGEQYQDTDTGLQYTRNGNSIVTVQGTQTLKIIITQAGVLAPTIDAQVNGLTGTMSLAYVNVGRYTLTSTQPDFTAGKTFITFGGNDTTGSAFKNVYRASTTVLNISTANNAGTYEDELLTQFSIYVEILP